MFKDSSFMEPLQLAGRIIMEYGGETFRVEETVSRMGRAFGLKQVEVFAIPSGIFLSYERGDGSTETAVKRVHRKGINLIKVNEVNCISRLLEDGSIDWSEALERLRALERAPDAHPSWVMVLAASVAAGGFSLMFGGGPWDALCGFFVAGMVRWISILLSRYHMHVVITSFLGGFISTLVPVAAAAITPVILADAVVGAALMPLLPGLAMTNAVQDTIRGDYMAGVTHGVYAVLIAVLLAGGSIAATFVFNAICGGVI